MAYVFNKINKMMSDNTQPSASSTAISNTSTNNDQLSNQKNPYESTFRNPNSVIERNISGGTNQPINLQQEISGGITRAKEGVQKDADTYSQNLKNAQNAYNYTQEQRQNLDSQLQKSLNPNESEFNAVSKTNVGSYRPNTDPITQGSTDEGTRTLLKNKYGYGTGMAGLDSLLFRASGQAGSNVNQALGDLKQYQNYASGVENQQTQDLASSKAAVKSQADALRQDLTSETGQMKTAAQKQAEEYNQRQTQLAAEQTAQANALKQQLQNEYRQRANFTDEDLLNFAKENGIDSLAQAAQAGGFNNADVLDFASLFGGDWMAYHDYLQNPKEFLRNNLQLGSFAGPEDINVNNYLTGPSGTADYSNFLDTNRYNKINSLLGSGDLVSTPVALQDRAFNQAKFTEDYQNRLRAQETAEKQRILDETRSKMFNTGSRIPQGLFSQIGSALGGVFGGF